ncbi:MAG: DUF5916 domain-containing protein, partial [Bacteroidota bacterium]
ENTTILGAAKVSGKTQSGLSLGILSSITEREFATINNNGEESKTEVEPLTSYNVGRFQQDFNDRQSSIGVMLTSVNRDLSSGEFNGLHSAAYSGGVDLIHRWKDRAWRLRVNGVWSQVRGSEEAIINTQTSFEHLFQRPDAEHLQVDSTATRLNGTGGTVAIGEFDGNWVFETGGTFRSPGIELNDIGFLNNAETIDYFAWGARRWRNPVGIFNRFQWNQNIYLGWDWNGTPLYRRYNTNVWGQFKNFWNFNASLNLEQLDVSKNILRGGPALRRPEGYNIWLNFGTDNRKKMTGWFYTGQGGSYDRNVTGQSYGAELYYQPTNALSVSVNADYDINERTERYFTTVEDGDRTEYIRSKLEKIKAGVAETVVNGCICIIIHGITIFFLIKCDLCIREGGVTSVKILSQWISYFFEFIVYPFCNERLTIILDSKVWCNIISSSHGKAKGFLFNSPYNVFGA